MLYSCPFSFVFLANISKWFVFVLSIVYSRPVLYQLITYFVFALSSKSPLRLFIAPLDVVLSCSFLDPKGFWVVLPVVPQWRQLSPRIPKICGRWLGDLLIIWVTLSNYSLVIFSDPTWDDDPNSDFHGICIYIIVYHVLLRWDNMGLHFSSKEVISADPISLAHISNIYSTSHMYAHSTHSDISHYSTLFNILYVYIYNYIYIFTCNIFETDALMKFMQQISTQLPATHWFSVSTRYHGQRPRRALRPALPSGQLRLRPDGSWKQLGRSTLGWVG